jgi:hypothetical protein
VGEALFLSRLEAGVATRTTRNVVGLFRGEEGPKSPKLYDMTEKAGVVGLRTIKGICFLLMPL